MFVSLFVITNIFECNEDLGHLVVLVQLEPQWFIMCLNATEA